MKAQIIYINKDIAHHEKLAFINLTLNGKSTVIARYSHSHNNPQ